MNLILDFLKSKELEIFSFDVNDKKLHYFYHADKVYILHELKNIKEINDLNDFLVFFSSSEIQEQIIKTLKFSDNDKISSVFNIQSFLWDLYFVVVHISEKSEDRINDEDINRIERNRFVARKVIIQANNYEEAIKELSELIFESEEIAKILESNQDVFSSDDKIILGKIIADDNIATHIKEELGINQELSLQDVSKYLLDVQGKTL